MTVGERIKQMRKESGFTQASLAKQMGAAEITIRQYELGKRIPSLDVLQEIADALSLSIRDLIPPAGQDEVQPLDSRGPHARISAALGQLNAKGQSIAVERVEELTKIPDYQRQETPTKASQEATVGENKKPQAKA